MRYCDDEPRPTTGRTTFASYPAPGARNEDLVIAGSDWVVVLDGATAPAGVDSGCIHDVVWLARTLGSALAADLATAPEGDLTDVLAEAIRKTRARHANTCDLSNPASPSATVAMVRRHRASFEILSLADSPIVIERRSARAVAFMDDRIRHLAGYTVADVEAARNVEGGFWVASTDPDAASHAVTCTVEIADVTRLAVLTDGAARYVEQFALGDWTALLDVLDGPGPDELIRRVRAVERVAPAGREKRHDDATAVLIHP